MRAKAMLLAAIAWLLAASGLAAAEPCSNVSHSGARYLVCTFQPSVSTIRVFNADQGGKPYGSFRSLEAALERQGEFLQFATNGGMYHPDMRPVGLLVENGKQKKPAVTGGGWGNFHLLPNGIFYIGAGRAGVMETNTFLASGIKPAFATQSGPMLVIDGRLHPKFLPDSDSFKIRNGVGIDGKGRVRFVISDDPVRFHDLATLFRDKLGCRNALYLDGTISSLYWPQGGRRDALFPLGPIIAVVGIARK
ncbi:phosphodiester glycosidase family protein [Rhizobiaceae bacterium n13]|uniref:Phosphodiester glycosidase family protein n=1 Tax=Ferirhizobium litorale TaxID=2927786 RepID=A0AAE3QHY5_9HYPH|nr:phosphodiester glycosidase family protein [Fererhizobium litorale]MDI7863600.1 phosphodiester glycosidase family protein [Fererhizobium litorale]MDI7923479.1 phosphodiester glycosidase family protein [Fererhizobium litorale]